MRKLNVGTLTNIDVELGRIERNLIAVNSILFHALSCGIYNNHDRPTECSPTIQIIGFNKLLLVNISTENNVHV